MSADSRTFRLRKLNDTEVYGPMNAAELRQLVDTAYVSPEDEIATKGENWKPVTEFPEFGMVWKVFAADGTLYGPTSLGTIREFVRTGEAGFDDQIIKDGEKTERTIGEVLGEKEVEALREEIAEAQRLLADEQLGQAFETAREIRIRTLEAELVGLRQEFEELKRKHLKACEDLARRR